MTVYNWLALFGVPALISACVAYVVKQFKQIKALKLGLQALLRDRLYSLYNTAIKRGFTDIDERNNFTNIYAQYHMLGANGVMDDIKHRYYELPDEVQIKKGV